MGVVENGPLAGLAFDALIARDPANILGHSMAKRYAREGFPLLVKRIEANDDLSVQVHPGDDYVLGQSDTGKSEMWYVTGALPDAYLLIGLKDGTTPEMLQSNPLACLNRLPVKVGDIIDIPAGLVHAITRGIQVVEIQQNSDITYRLYDYDRLGLDGKPRPLHLKDGLAVADFSNTHPKEAVSGNTVTNSYFTCIKYEINNIYSEKSDPDNFSIFTCVEGECRVGGVPVSQGRSVLVPAGLGGFTILAQGRAVLLKSFATIKF